MKNLRKNLKKNQKGFTLVEIIVVLVILAILAAASIPTMIGFVEDAKGKSEIANARAAYVAAQSIATEEYASGLTSATGGTGTLITGKTYIISTTITAPSSPVATDNYKLNKMLKTDLAGASVRATVVDGEVTVLQYLNNSYLVKITGGTGTEVTKGGTIA